MYIAVIQASFPFADPMRNAARLLELAHLAESDGAALCIAPEFAVSGVLPRDLLLDHHFAEKCRLAMSWLAEQLGPEGPSLLVGSPLVSNPKGERPDMRYARRKDDRAGLLNCAVLIEKGETRVIAAQRHLLPSDGYDFARYFSPGWGGGFFTLREMNFAVVTGHDVVACATRGEDYLKSLLRDSFAVKKEGGDTWVGARYPAPEGEGAPAAYPQDVFPGGFDPQLDAAVQPNAPESPTADAVLCIAAMPFSGRGGYLLNRALAELAGKAGLPVIFANAVSAAGGTLFDGGSLLLSCTGTIEASAKHFEEEIFPLKAELENAPALVPGIPGPARALIRPVRDRDIPLHAHVAKEETLFKALQWGLKRYVEDNGFKRVFLGLSGGLDSAMCAAIAAESLGPRAVCGVLMPSPHTSKESMDLAQSLVKNLDIDSQTIPIEGLMTEFDAALADSFAGLPKGVAEENLQARIRGALLMALSNKLGGIVICPGNKSELAVGYSTLYGDSAGALALIGDVYKSDIYELAKWYNERADREIIPGGIITRPPTAELCPGQLDTDCLPPYPILDAVLRQYIEEGHTSGDIRVSDADAALVAKVVKMVRSAEFKRRQAPPVLEVSMRPFGPNWRMPL